MVSHSNEYRAPGDGETARTLKKTDARRTEGLDRDGGLEEP